MTSQYQSIFLTLLRFLSADAYEIRRARRGGLALPECFNATRSIFVHIPKTGGISVATGLYGQLVPHYTWRDWRRANPRKFREYFKFAVVRDPVSRFASAFEFLKSGGMNAEDKAFGEEILAPFPTANHLAEALERPALRARVMNQCHFTPQAEFVADRAGRLQMNLLVRFENLQAGFELVSHRLNRPDVALPHLNRTGTPAILIDDRTRDVVKRLYRADQIMWEQQAV